MKSTLITLALLCGLTFTSVAQNYFIDPSFAQQGKFISLQNQLNKNFSNPETYGFSEFKNITNTVSAYSEPYLYVLSRKLDTVHSSWGLHTIFLGTEILCLDSSGTINTNFGVAGRLSISDSSQLAPHGNSILTQPDGKLIVFQNGAISRFLSNGQPDSTFGTNGHTDVSGNVLNGALQSDGKIVYKTKTGIDRLHGNGMADSTFTAFQFPTISDHFNEEILMHINGQNQIFTFVNRVKSNPFSKPRSFAQAYKISPNGGLDTSFQFIDTSEVELKSFTSICFLPTGELLLGNLYGEILKLDSQGNHVLAFGTNGVLQLPRLGLDYTWGYNVIISISTTSNGKIRIGMNQQTGTITESYGSWGTGYYTTPKYYQYRFSLLTIDSIGNNSIDCSTDYLTTTNHERGVTETYNMNGKEILVGNYNISIISYPSSSDVQFLNVSRQNSNRSSSIQPQIVASNNELQALPDTGLFYQWFDCTTNQPIKGATQSAFTPTTSGTYGVTAYFEDGCAASNCYAYNIGEAEVALNDQLFIYPNPTKDQFRVQGLSPDKKYTYHIMTSIGQIVKTGSLDAESISLAMQPSGLYLVVIPEADQVLRIQKW